MVATSSAEKDFSARCRRRASLACLSCRKSRIRCKVEPGQNACTQCRQSRAECTFDPKDGRKNRANSKAAANELSRRIQQLESLLRDTSRGRALPPSPPNAAPKEHHQLAIETDSDSQSNFTSCYDEETLPCPGLSHHPPIPQQDYFSAHNNAILRRLIPRPVKFDMASGRVRFFGPTTNMHLLSRSMLDPGKSTETYWPISALVRDLSPETHDYLIDLFFDCHNSNVHIVHKWAFLEDLKSGDTQFYSNFLHMCMLAEGWRYADRTRPDIKRLACPGPDSSTFHTKARKMAELELTKPGGIPSIQAFSLLGDLEAGTGRDDTGWMFAGMAFRLLFDVGLHVDPSELRLAEREVQIRHMVLWACVMNDAYWALYLGRPTMLKASDIAPACLNKDFDRLIYSQSRTYVYGKTIETRIYEALLQLMDLLGPLCETRNASKSLKPTDAQLKIATLDQQLNIWHINLPETLRWSSENVLKAPASFYLLHTQYHTALILLHRTFTTHSTDPQDTAHHNESIHFSSLCRHTCVSNAVQVAEIISMYRKRFPIKRMFVTGLQHIGTAATSIMAEISMIHSEQQSLERERLVKHLADLKMSLEEMSNMYQPAKLMTSVVEHFIRDHGNMMGDHIATTETDTANPLSELSSSSSSSSQQAWIMPIIANDTNPSTSMPSNSRSPFLSPARLQMEETATQLHAAQNRQPSFNSAEGLPFLPSTWFDEMNWEEDDTDFLNLVGLKELQALRGGDLMGNGLGMNGLAEGGAI